MADKSYRIRTGVGSDDKCLSVHLRQGVKTLDILSLTINPEDAYEKHTSDYGVIVGRVLANNAYGVPNVKVSVFIPISPEDEGDYVISSEYPYRTVSSTDSKGVRYNLLQDSDYSGPDGKFHPIGTFPNKRMVLDNDGQVEVFGKYWKFTATTNKSGDYMIFGVPTGTTQVHYDCDLSDIGILSQKPYDFVNKGYSPQMFKSPTEFLDGDLSSAVHVISQTKSVTVYPFWGDEDVNEIGITRSDLNLDYEFEPSCVFMGSSITDSPGTYINAYGYPNGNNGRFGSLTTSTGNIEIVRKRQDGTVEEVRENVTGIIDGNGVWCYAIPMNLDRVGTDEEGNIVAVNDPKKGIPTRARMRFRLTLTDCNDDSTYEYAAKILVPCNPPLYGNRYSWPTIAVDDVDWGNFYQFGSRTPECCFRDMYWGKVYTVKQYYPRIQAGMSKLAMVDTSTNSPWKKDIDWDCSAYPPTAHSPFSCISSIDSVTGRNAFPYNTMYSGAEAPNDDNTKDWFTYHLTENAKNDNYSSKGLHFCFENDWVNGCLYFPKVKISRNRDGSYLYFGSRSKYEGSVTSYNSEYAPLYITGRHHWYYMNGAFTTKHVYNSKWDRNNPGKSVWIDQTACLSYVNLQSGIIQEETTTLGEHVFYYKCGEKRKNSAGKEEDYLFYATDIVLLGNVVNIYDSLPNLAVEIPSTSTIFPPLVPPKDFSEAGMNMNAYNDQLDIMYEKDTDDVDAFGNFLKPTPGKEVEFWEDFDLKKIGEGCYGFTNPDTMVWEPEKNTREAVTIYRDGIISSTPYGTTVYSWQPLQFIQERMSLFFGFKVYGCRDFLHYMTPSFVNLSRICELDVENDHSFRNKKGGIIGINGIIDRHEISSNERRSAFASMNHDITRYVVDKNTRHRRYMPTPMYMVDFDGRLRDYVNERNIMNCTEEADRSYIRFRFGDNDYPMRYTTADPLYITANSFYFYFGLNSGFSAIDEFANRYYSKGTMTERQMYKLEVTTTNNIGPDASRTSTIHVSIPRTMKKPYSVFVYKNHSLVTKIYNPGSNTISMSGFSRGLYNVIVEDAAGSMASGQVLCNPQYVTIEYETEVSTTSGSCLVITSIDGANVFLSVEKYMSEHMFQVRCQNLEQGWTNNYRLKFGKEFVDINDHDTNKLICVFSGGTEHTGSIWDTNSYADKTFFSFRFQQEEYDETTFCGVPIKYIPLWQSNSPSEKQWMSWMTATMSPNGNPYTLQFTQLQAVPEREQMEYLSSMLSCIFDGGRMDIDSDYNMNMYSISPVYEEFNLENRDPGEAWNNPISNTEKYPWLVKRNGTSEVSYNAPHIVAQNYPREMTQRGYVKTADLGQSQYGDNMALRISGSTGTETACGNFFRIEDRDSGAAYPNGSFIAPRPEQSYGRWSLTSFCNGTLWIRTMDRRLDYQLCIQTPLILPSGYGMFTNLHSMAIRKGKLDSSIYGGLKFDFKDSGSEIYKITTYRYDNTSKSVVGSPSTSGSTWYREYVYEDDSDSADNEVKYISDNITETRKRIWDPLFNDQINFSSDESTGLTGKTSLNMDIVACSPRIGDGYVVPGRSLGLSISYESPITLVQKPLVPGTDSEYAIHYVIGEESEHTAIGRLDEGSVLKFMVHGDSLYTGATYTDLETESGHTGSAEYPEWTRSCDTGRPSGAPEICILSHSGVTDQNVDIILVSMESSSVDVKYDSEVAYYAHRTNDEGENVIVSDDEASELFIFSYDHDKNSGDTEFTNGTEFLTIPTRRLYSGGVMTLMNQCMVYTSGHAYYASQIEIHSGTQYYHVRLYSPLASTVTGEIQTDTEYLASGNTAHTIGDMESYYCNDHVVQYEPSKAEFLIAHVSDGEEITLYFKMVNGLSYRVDIPQMEVEEGFE